MKFLPLTRDEVTFELTIEEEDFDFRGNAMASGDDELDREVEDEILERLRCGDLWAWGCVKVTARWQTHTGVAYLGACNFKDEADFRACYGSQLEDEALDDLNRQLDKLTKTIEPRLVCDHYFAQNDLLATFQPEDLP